eukprot:TRINITY_DN17643_c0_g3_i2.p1 TRINITY_DN17643_c0_g3~~TRINITY_DN17643_c0_g3_i2.p1  ORF type:complete len:110 (+),score=10.27 TRINITY_DN17643_c0_g3_i2:482-811(+)
MAFQSFFFQHFWDMLEADLLIFFNHFHENGVIAGELGATFISLIPKKDGASLIKDYRPISLIGSLYKILAKLLANRLRVCLVQLSKSPFRAFGFSKLKTAKKCVWLTRF